MRLSTLVASLLVCLIHTVWLVAQDEVPLPAPKVIAIQGIADGQTGGVVYSTIGDITTLPMALPLSGGFLGGGNPSDDMSMLAMDQFQQELELLDEQKEKLTALRKRLQEKRSALYGDIRSMDPRKLGPYLKEAEGLLQDEGKEKLHEILLPHQVDRLKQLRVQMQMRSGGVNALAAGELAEVLELTDEQKAKLAEKQKEAEKQLREKLDEIRKQLQRDVLNEVLTAAQRDKLVKLIGDEFKYKPVEPQFPRPTTLAEPVKLKK